ncbi:hypothetical protein SARC_09284 [Sphaeroforma arctica JP610]|uniref:VIT domain-containing protein n=1 Tax=Sphaeroforma arctica JP610 TaxID=667725 RepID=A0A0L0FNB8_9EUKA|nr:hypothetical protein SARC_09284 [Sphaeroforma arctica JP610]KNC78282.1 hypothetical protein SARC_09284 [Sphaeroforma arctica JP610]|eukprot:XP_014152184.1 hypothetical protein SARC_09284 [Sphaeroforma arctica JP610]
MMVLLCTLAWALPPAIQFKGITVDVYGPPAHATAKAQVRSSLTEGHIERRFKVSIETLTVAETLIKPNKGMALAVSVGCGEDNRAQVQLIFVPTYTYTT